MKEKKFIKQIRRKEIKTEIGCLRMMVRIEQRRIGETEDVEAYLDSEQFVRGANIVVALRAKIKKLFKARNDFSVFEKLDTGKLTEIKDAVESLKAYEKEYKEAEKVAGRLGYPDVQCYDYALAAEYCAAEDRVNKLYRSVIGA